MGMDPTPSARTPPESPSLGLTPLSRVRLDELLSELLDRVGNVVTSRERLRALLNAVVRISTDLDLRSTLERIVISACRLAGAQYGALGVIGDDRQLIEFIKHGRAIHRAGGTQVGVPPGASRRRAVQAGWTTTRLGRGVRGRSSGRLVTMRSLYRTGS